MKNKLTLIVVVMTTFFTAYSLKGESLSVRTNSMVNNATNTIPFKIVAIKSDYIPLPLADKMDFDSDTPGPGAPYGRDSFNWNLWRISKRGAVGPFVISQYPVTLTGPHTDYIAVGIGIRFKLK